jgi:hypothetical protein
MFKMSNKKGNKAAAKVQTAQLEAKASAKTEKQNKIDKAKADQEKIMNKAAINDKSFSDLQQVVILSLLKIFGQKQSTPTDKLCYAIKDLVAGAYFQSFTIEEIVSEANKYPTSQNESLNNKVLRFLACLDIIPCSVVDPLAYIAKASNRRKSEFQSIFSLVQEKLEIDKKLSNITSQRATITKKVITVGKSDTKKISTPIPILRGHTATEVESKYYDPLLRPTKPSK